MVEKNNLNHGHQEAKERQEGVRDKVSFKSIPCDLLSLTRPCFPKVSAAMNS